MDFGVLPGAVAIGAGATLMMDLWNLVLKRAFGIPSLNYCLLGRWVFHMPSGQLRHPGIAAATPKPGECPVGWLAHYATGVLFAVVFVMAMVGTDWLTRPSLLPALLYGVVTVVFPLFVMQPALGLGLASSRTPDPTRARLKSLGTHIIFGLGLYASALVSRSLGLTD